MKDNLIIFCNNKNTTLKMISFMNNNLKNQKIKILKFLILIKKIKN